jgi:hypothetical protein
MPDRLPPQHRHEQMADTADVFANAVGSCEQTVSEPGNAQ